MSACLIQEVGVVVLVEPNDQLSTPRQQPEEVTLGNRLDDCRTDFFSRGTLLSVPYLSNDRGQSPVCTIGGLLLRCAWSRSRARSSCRSSFVDDQRPLVVGTREERIGMFFVVGR